MRLNKNEIAAIVSAVTSRFTPDARIYLFGSRINDDAKGGDIDLIVRHPNSTDRAIFYEALKHGELLA